MIVTTHRIQYKYGDTITIKNLADVHLGNAYCDKQAFRKYLKDSDDNTYFVSTGDLLDSITLQDWRYEKHADDSKSDAIIDDQVEMLLDYLNPYKDKIIGLGRGNHEKTIIKKCGTDPIKRVCDIIGCKYLGYSWIVGLILHEDGQRGRTVDIYGHHGFGGGRTEGADLTKYWRHARCWNADVYFYGHTHQKLTDQRDRLGRSGKRLIAKNQYLAVCGTFLKTFSETTNSTYSEEAGYAPVAIGGIALRIRPDERWVRIKFDE